MLEHKMTQTSLKIRRKRRTQRTLKMKVCSSYPPQRFNKAYFPSTDPVRTSSSIKNPDVCSTVLELIAIAWESIATQLEKHAISRQVTAFVLLLYIFSSFSLISPLSAYVSCS